MAIIEATPETTASTQPAPTSTPAPYRWRWIALAVAMSGMAMELLDASVTSVAGPTMRAELGGGPSLIQWLTAGYTLAMVGGLLIGARLGDIFGRKRMFLFGATGFTLTSLLVALSQNPEFAIGSRVAQGLFGAAMVPQVFGLIKAMFPPSETQKAFSLAGPIMGMSAIGGPILAGWLIGLNLFDSGWRLVFLINLPIGIAIVALAFRLLPRDEPATVKSLDLAGATLAILASTSMVYPLVQGHEAGWPAWSFGMIAASVVLFAVFGAHQVRRNRRGRDVLVLPSLFHKRAFNGGLVLGVLLIAAMTGLGFVMTLHLQLGLAYTPLEAAAAMVPFAVAMSAAMGAGPALAKYGRKTLMAGALIKTAGIGAIILALALAGADLTWYHLAPGLMLSGVGAALFMGRYFDSVMEGVEPREIGSASGTLTAVQQLGASFGVALLGTAFFATYGPDVDSAVTASGTTLGLTGLILLVGFAVGFCLPKQTRTAD
ncbi:MFS transporter [Stackebrandtia nassauensis]|uniref:Major facilitator superfamily MFS_1 n=1 Tax=Stackebrandtia nassauensis (strain DSM 44728 / CIP 108903 / NRRL B-16338 / NBRC 102104 / LLR-40K-21) TaxID=446470 RepID=D3Q890_STANL|nr:MFS transporter [Stackebrandtia nassauensis]ADD42464.1 major facilitator superfamily MFS_1 [Stackebrandtia nassauensis DSM 44728]